MGSGASFGMAQAYRPGVARQGALYSIEIASANERFRQLSGLPCVEGMSQDDKDDHTPPNPPRPERAGAGYALPKSLGNPAGWHRMVTFPARAVDPRLAKRLTTLDFIYAMAGILAGVTCMVLGVACSSRG